MNNRYIIPLVFVVAAIYFGVWGWLAYQEKQAITTFEECAAAGNPIMESYPEQCIANGKTFTRVVDDIGKVTPPTGEYEVLSTQVRLKTPHSNATVTSPLIVSGDARGTWYFEASFPVRLLDGNGKEIAVIPAQAQSDWMTENFVPFIATLTFSAPTTETGTLVLQKDNPSGLPEHDAEVKIPVRFKSAGVPSILPYQSGIRGSVTIGPTCPVVQYPPTGACDDKPYETTLSIINTSGKQVAIATSKKDGTFVIALPPGVYTIKPNAPPARMPYAASQTVTVPATGYVDVTISYDSGIR